MYERYSCAFPLRNKLSAEDRSFEMARLQSNLQKCQVAAFPWNITLGMRKYFCLDVYSTVLNKKSIMFNISIKGICQL